MKKPYPATKPSGVEWLGDIPEHWESPRLSAHFYERNEKVNDTDYPPLSVTMKGIVPQLANVAKTNATDNRKMVCCNDFVINSRSDRKGSSGTSDYEGSVSLISIVLTPREYDPKFAHHLFRSYNFQEEFYRYGSGIVADLWSTRFSEMKNIRIPVFSIPEQQQIARYLDGETGRIDGLVLEKQRFVELLKEKRQALISHVVTKGLNPAAPLKPTGIDWIGDVPEHWSLRRAKACFEFITSGSRGWAQYYADSGSIFFRIGNLQRGAIDPDLSKLQYVDPPLGAEGERSKIKQGDLLISITADLGSIGVASKALIGAFVSQHVALARPDWFQVGSARWIAYLLISESVRNQFQSRGYGGTKVQLSLEDVRELQVAVPPLTEQQQIADHLDRETGRIDELVAEVGISIALLKEERTALISAAVTGKIDVREKM